MSFEDRPAPSDQRIVRRDAVATRARILDVAKQSFATEGYASTGMREIADAAGIDKALIYRYFGSKEELFEAALRDSLDGVAPGEADRAGFGREIVDRLLARRDGAPASLPMILFAVSDPVSKSIGMRLLEEHIVAPLARWFGKPTGAELAGRLCILLSGLFLYSNLLPIAPFADGMPADTQQWIVDMLQRVIDERGGA